MFLLVCLALLNGVLIGASRAVNGHLGKKVGAARTSLWNHAVGFAFLSVLIGTIYRDEIAVGPGAPVSAWLGGVLGVIFVALNSHVIPRLGAGRTVSLVVAAQMLAGVALDSFSKPISSATGVALGGAVLIISGVWLSASTAEQ
ncbi:MAG: DMT family transporter [Phyllobacterium sp.]